MIAAIIARLLAEIPSLKFVGAAAAFQQASESNPRATPAAFVFIVEESPDESSVDAPFIQEVDVTLAVVLVVRNVGDTVGAAAGVDIDSLRAEVRATLMGYSPSAGYDPLARRKSALLAFRDGHMWWQETWSTHYTDVGA